MTADPYICPHCKNPIHDEDALLCHFCGESLQRAGSGFLSNLKYSQNQIVWILIIVAVLMAFILLYVVF